jgi:hypothetical protein
LSRSMWPEEFVEQGSSQCLLMSPVRLDPAFVSNDVGALAFVEFRRVAAYWKETMKRD